MDAALFDDPLALVQRLCEIGGKSLIIAANIIGDTAPLHIACYLDDPNINTVKYLAYQNGGTELIKKQNNYGYTALDYAKGKGDEFVYTCLSGMNLLVVAVCIIYNAFCLELWKMSAACIKILMTRLPTQVLAGGTGAVLIAQEMEKNEAFAVLFVIISGLRIVSGFSSSVCFRFMLVSAVL